jgi:hypothetical protein
VIYLWETMTLVSETIFLGIPLIIFFWEDSSLLVTLTFLWEVIYLLVTNFLEILIFLLEIYP